MLDDFRIRRGAGWLSGEVDLAVASEAEIELLGVAVATPGPQVVFDCAALTFIDASGITMLLQVAQRSGKQIRLENVQPACRRVFEILDLCGQFGIEATAAEGRAQLRLPA